MENGSQGIAASNGGNAGALSLDMRSTGPTAPVVSATPAISVPDPIPAPTNRSRPGTPSGPPKPRGKRPTKLLLSAGVIMLVIIFIGGLLFILHAFQNNSGEKQNISSQFDNVEVPLNQLVDQPGINVLGARSLVINGQLRTNDGLVVAPSTAPTTPTAGQIYYDKNNNQLGYYNGSQFIYVTSAKASVDSLGGATGAITTGTGLQLVGNSLSNSGVLSFQGQSGAVTLTAGDGVAINGTTVTNSGDLTVGNEIADVVSGSGLLRVGNGTTLDPYKVAMQSCANGEVLKSSGSGAWACGTDNGTASTAGNGLQLIGNEFSVNSPTCAGSDKLSWNGTAFVCSADLGGTAYSAGTGLSLVGTTFSNSGVLSITGSGPVTATAGQNPTIGFTNGSSVGQIWQWNGTAWALTTLAGEGDGVVGNEVTDVTGANSGLARSGSGTSGSPYTLAVNAGNGLQLSGGAVLISSPTCAGTDKLQWNGTAFVCAPDVDTDTNTTYGTISNGGLRMVGTNFGLTACATGELLQAQVTSGEWDCVSPSGVGIAYTAGNGLGLTGTNFAVNSPTCAGTDKLQWTGTAFQCSNDVDTDAQTLSWVDGTRTLSISNGNSVVIPDSDTTYSAAANGGLSLVGTQFTLATCANGEIMKAQATSGQWACGTDNSASYSAGTGLSLVGNTFSNSGILTVTGSGAIAATAGQNPTISFSNGTVNGQFWQWNGSAWVLATLPVDGDSVTGNEVTNITGVNSGLARSGTGTSGSPYTLGLTTCANTEILQSSGSGNWACAAPTGVGTAYNIIPNGGLRLAGSNFGLKTCSAGELLQAQATSGEWDCVTSTGVGTSYVAGTGVDITGSTISNTGVLSVIGSGPITSSGGQNPSIDFVDGNTTGQFWQWNGTDWVLAMLPGEGDAVVGNEVTDVTGANSGLLRSGTGTAGNPYTLAVNAGSGLQLSGGAVLINSPTCSGTDKLQWNGTAFICSSDVDTNTTYGAITNGGLRLNGTNFGLAICASGELLQAQVTSGEWACVAPNTVGTGYTAGNGLGLAGTQFSVNSPTCAGTDKLQWNGTAFVCSADVNTDAQTLTWVSGTRTLSISGGNNVVIGDSDTTYSATANGGLSLVGTQFALSACTTNQILKAQVTSGQWACAADADTTYSAGTGVSLVGTTFSNSGIISLTGTSNINITAGQNPTIGFVNGSSIGQVWQWNGSAWVLATVSGGSLQTAYTASTGGTTPEIKLDSTRGGLDIQDADTTIGANLLNVRASNGSGLGSILLGVGNTGAFTSQNSTDSTAAFRILNSTGGSLMTVDSTGSNIALLGNNTSALSTWTTTTAMSVGASTVRVRGDAVAANGYLYYIGGNDNNSGNTISTVEYAKINADGTIGTWASTTSLNDGSNAPRRQFKAVAMNGFLYVIGGRDASNATKTTAMYAKLNSDGTVGSWKTTTALPSARFGAGTFAYNGYMYVMGGFNSSVAQTNTIYYAKVNPDGTLGSWTTNAINIDDSLGNIKGTTVANGYVYIPGGYSVAAAGTANDLRHAKLNSDGSVGSWTNQGTWLGGNGDDDFLSYVSNGYLYVVGGDNSWSSPRVEAMQLNADGNVGGPTTLPSFPQSLVGEAAMAQANGYLYLLGGSSIPDGGGTVRNSVYYTSGSRVKVGGNLDLVSFSGENLAEDGASGQLTAGNTIVTGTLQVQDVANFVRSVSIGDSLRVGGMATVSADSATAFQVQKADGTPLLTADTTNSRFYIGPVAGNTTGALVVLGNKTNAGDPAGVEGAMYYNSSLKQFRCYRDTNWETCGVNPIDRGFTVTDEFLGGCNNNINNNHFFGELGWTNQTIGANGSTNCNPANPTPSADHPGVFYVSTPAVSNQGSTLTLGNSNNGSVVIGGNYTVKQTMAVDSNSGVVVRAGLHNETTGTGQPTSGVWWEADPPSHANWRYCYGDGTTATCANSSVAVTANAWVRLEIRVTAVGSGASAATFIINGAANTVSGVTIDSTNRVYPANTCYTTTSIARQCSYDYFQLQGIASAAR